MKKFINMLFVMLAISVLAACGKGETDSQETTEPDNTPIYSVQLELKCIENLIFNKYDMNIFVDGDKIGKLDHGATRTYSVELKEGTHTLVVTKEGASSVDGTINFSVSEDAEYQYKISCTSQQIELEEIIEDEPEAKAPDIKTDTDSKNLDVNGDAETSTDTDTDNSSPETTNSIPSSMSLRYSTNDLATAKKGNTGVFSYRKSGKSYDLYWVIDFDEGYVYHFMEGNGDDVCDRLLIESGDLNSVIIITYHDGDDEWSYGLHFKWKNMPDILIMQDNDGFEDEYSTTSLNDALELRDSKIIKDY